MATDAQCESSRMAARGQLMLHCGARALFYTAKEFASALSHSPAQLLQDSTGLIWEVSDECTHTGFCRASGYGTTQIRLGMWAGVCPFGSCPSLSVLYPVPCSMVPLPQVNCSQLRMLRLGLNPVVFVQSWKCEGSNV